MNIQIRLVENQDYYRNHLELLGQLTNVTKIEVGRYWQQLQYIQSQNGYIYVLVDIEKDKIVGSITLLIEYKLIRNCGKVGHIEDVVVDKNYRGKGLGKKLIEHAKFEAKDRGCYKIILDCSDDNSEFYAKCGLTKKEIQMVSYFNT